MRRTHLWLALTPPAAGALAYLVVPRGTVAQLWLYEAVSFWSLAVAVIGLRLNRPTRPRVWWALLAGMTAWIAGDVVWAWAVWVRHEEPFPSWADAWFLVGYAALILGLCWLVRGRQPGRDVAALLDATVVAVGVGVVVGTFVIVPVAVDSSQTVLGRLVGSAYPLADVLLLGLLARLVSTPGGTTVAYRALVGAMAASLLADAGYNVVTLIGRSTVTPRWLDTSWLACYVLLAAAAAHPSMRGLSEPAPQREETLTRRRLVALGAASALAPCTLLLQVVVGDTPSIVLAAVGSLVLSALVLTRMAGLLERVRSQAVQLAALASLDSLTGVPNRRTWDLELSRACARARLEGEPLAVALLDLDHFKAFNDRHGHQAGDLLLKEATAAWTAALRPEDLLARYGGEEFAVVLHGVDGPDAARLLERLRGLTPLGQSFSAGVTVWDGVEEPSGAIARADEALYRAKDAGRDRITVWSPRGGATGPGAPQPTAPGSPVAVGG